MGRTNVCVLGRTSVSAVVTNEEPSAEAEPGQPEPSWVSALRVGTGGHRGPTGRLPCGVHT